MDPEVVPAVPPREVKVRVGESAILYPSPIVAPDEMLAVIQKYPVELLLMVTPVIGEMMTVPPEAGMEEIL